MAKALFGISERLYRYLLRLYPKKYRQEFGKEMQYVFTQSLRDAYLEDKEQGVLGLWTRTIVDTGKSLFIQHIEDHKEGEFMKTKNNDILKNDQIFFWLALATGGVLLIPLIAMQWETGVNWSLFDFLVMGTLLFGSSSLFVLAARRLTSTQSRAIVGLGFAAAFLLLWIELAVGLFTNWGS